MKFLICLSYCVAPVLTQMILTGKGLDTSSTLPGNEPELAIDGDGNTYFMSNYTLPGEAYWQIDLEGYYDVNEIRIQFPNMVRNPPENRTISLSKYSTFEPAHTFLCGQNIPGTTSTWMCQGLFAVQYIRVTTDQPPLVLHEIVIYADQAVQPVLEGTSLETITTTTTTTTVSSGSSYRVMPGYTLTTPTATLTTPMVTMCSIWCQQSLGCTAFSFNKGLLVNNCKIGASQETTLSSGWTANIKGAVMDMRRAGYSCS
ncbi:uncharacterized protein LOC124272239 [Haliotis rubra]|uniref:uncharacterized protein LOC124272239 n=1 Tax=Haliotis rubra TaxID=36100 RepID=UPI001EE5D164|nr:uncharacterized protein LOC124272239 [Haliotis rubra]